MATIKEKLGPTWFDVFKGTPEEASFLVGPLSPYDAIDFRNEISMSRGKVRISGEGIRIAGNAVRDWRNVRNEQGEELKFSRDQFDQLAPRYLESIASEVFRRTFLSEIERKNSSSPSTSG
jgi:hypothetical protein